MNVKYIFDLSKEELEQYIMSVGEPKYRATQIWDALRSGRGLGNVPATLIEKIKSDFFTEFPEIIKEVKSKDGTRKLLLRLHDGQMIETVVLTQDYGVTVCISSQVGCKMGCAFCASGKDGFVRNLSAGEMLAQIVIARNESDVSEALSKQSSDKKVNNVVVMGSGEPFDNFDNLVKFLSLTDVGARHISVSTVGLVDRIKQFADLKLQVNLCISLHASNDFVRNRILPASKSFPISDLIKASKYFFEKTKRRVIFEYALIDGVNCEPEHAVELAKLVKGFPSHINLINMNPHPDSDLQPPMREVAMRFMDCLIKSGASVTMRKSRGNDISAACGQLKNQSKKKTLANN